MKFKYYLRGFGTGVLFATILLIVALGIHNNIQSNQSKESTTENTIVINKGTETTSKDDGNMAQSEGDTEESDKVLDMSEDLSDTTVSSIENVTEAHTQPVATDSETEDSSDDILTQTEPATESVTGQPATTHSETQEQPFIEPSTVGGQNITSVVVTIERGMTSGDAARLLAQFGLVDDAVAFDEYMETAGYESGLKIGSYEITRGATYEEIARIITQSQP